MEKELIFLKKKYHDLIKNIQNEKQINEVYLKIFGQNGEFSLLIKQINKLEISQRPKIGKIANQVKDDLENIIQNKKDEFAQYQYQKIFDVTAPGINPPLGHLHLVTYAISEISRIFENIGFSRVRYPEIEWEWFAFDSLNMPKNHPARDDFETFFIESSTINSNFGKMVLSPHTSSGQVREMQRVKTPPIRMINIAKCYRPNWDVSHTPMFHQFEGLVVDKNINISHLKGTFEYFVHEFFDKNRKIRLRPFHFQFTEPSFEVDISCDVCNGSGCRLCKEGWLELGGAGMVHPNVLHAGKIDPNIYTGYAFGWGVERTYMMKQGLKIDDLRLLYSNDIRFLEQF